MENYSLADIKAATDGNDGLFGGSGAWLIVLLLFWGFLGGNGFGYNRGESVPLATAQQSFDIDKDVLTSGCSTQKEILQSRYDAALGMNNIQAQMASCCCDIKTSIANEAAATRQLIQDNTIQELRDRLNTANNALTVQTITNNVVSQLQPTPKPAYLTCSPYASYPYGYYNGTTI
nr:MAG TPA: hypothetical protein [Caudoviricetes sp.]